MILDRGVVLVLLAVVDGVISAIFGALLLSSRIGSVPFPVSVLVSGLANAALVWAGLQCTRSLRLAAISLWTWGPPLTPTFRQSPAAIQG